MNKGHDTSPGKKRKHLRIAPENSMDAEAIPVSVPRIFLSADKIREKEAEGRTVIFVVKKTISSISAEGNPSIDIKPLRDTAGNYLVIVCW